LFGDTCGRGRAEAPRRANKKGDSMRALWFAAAFMVCLCGPGSAYQLQTEKGQVVCETLRGFEELTIAIGLNDGAAINEMIGKGCRVPGPGLGMELIEAYPDQTALLFRKLAESTDIGPVPAHIERLTSLAQVRLLYPDGAPVIGFTMLRASPPSEPRTD
jgi:hypothetical protein